MAKGNRKTALLFSGAVEKNDRNELKPDEGVTFWIGTRNSTRFQNPEECKKRERADFEGNRLVLVFSEMDAEKAEVKDSAPLFLLVGFF